jgi:hypothetical protein
LAVRLTRPTAAQRIQRARRQAEPGVFAAEKPARALFRDFAAAARAVTTRHYRANLRLPVTEAMLKPAGAFFQETPPTAPEPTTPPEPLASPVPKLRLRRPTPADPS